jgi:phosphatidylglycerophosphate synthase
VPDHSPRWYLLAVPNALSVLRVALAVLFPLLDTPGRVALVLAATASDGIDGIAARALKATTWWGGILDAACDKVFTFTVLITLTAVGQMPTWQLPPLLLRDLVVIAIFTTVIAQQDWPVLKKLAAALLGKLTTVALFVFMLLVPLFHHVWWLTLGAFLVTAGLGTAASVDYVVRYFALKRAPTL